MSEFNNTYSTGFSLKENEKKQLLEFGNNIISNLDDKNNKETNLFKEPQYEIKWVDDLQNSYYLKQDIERVWLLTRSFDILTLITYHSKYPCVFIKGEDTWKEGNQFKGSFYNYFPFVAKVNKSLNLPEMKKIEWLFNINGNEYFMLKFQLFQVTEENTTVALRVFKI